MKPKFKAFTLSALLLATFFFKSCSDDDTDPNGSLGDEQFVLVVTTDQANRSGVLLTFDEMPSGEIDPSAMASIASGGTGVSGFVYGDAIYEDNNFAGDRGIQKLTFDASGELTDAGFILGASPFEMISETKGYYWNSELNPNALQTFNPSTMQRTGEIDLSSALEPYITEEVVSVYIGFFLKEANGLLYATVDFQDENFVPVMDSTFVMTFDINTDTFKEWIIYPDFRSLGYYNAQHGIRYVNDAEDGYLYLGTWSQENQIPNATVLRIRAGETEFDPNFKVSVNDLVGDRGFMIGGTTYMNGKLYGMAMDERVEDDYSNMDPAFTNFFAYEIDVTTQEMEKIEGIPGGWFGSTLAPFRYNDKIYFYVTQSDYQGVHSYNPITGDTEEVFTLASGNLNEVYIVNPQ